MLARQPSKLGLSPTYMRYVELLAGVGAPGHQEEGMGRAPSVELRCRGGRWEGGGGQQGVGEDEPGVSLGRCRRSCTRVKKIMHQGT
jgi:hypothetical protein